MQVHIWTHSDFDSIHNICPSSSWTKSQNGGMQVMYSPTTTPEQVTAYSYLEKKASFIQWDDNEYITE